MPQIKVTLGIGVANARQEDILDIPQDEWDACETSEDRDELMDQYWNDWAGNYIDGGFELVEE